MSITAHEPRTAGDEDPLIRFTDEEWQRALAMSLERLGLTFEELQQQAEDGDFSSGRARALWVAIGGRRAQRH